MNDNNYSGSERSVRLKDSLASNKAEVGEGNNNFFRSEHFSDEQILCQLCDGDYQTKLSDHNWPALESMGPCFYTLAETMLPNNKDQKTIQEALSDQSNLILPEVVEHLKSNPTIVVLDAMREIAESYLSRGIKKVQSSNSNRKEENWKKPPKTVLQGTRGKKYHPIDYIASGSASVVYSAERVEEDTRRVPNVALKIIKRS